MEEPRSVIDLQNVYEEFRIKQHNSKQGLIA